jgi:Dolichyl-phosphate-mannose-protein mannosyltransferase
VELRGLLGLYLATQVTLARRRRWFERRDIAPVPADRLDRALVAIIFIAANAILLATAPANGDFWWSDAPRHALNGAFVKDFIAAMPWHDPKAWAIDYYLQYPSLSILFYPPLFYFVEAVAFAVFGVSHLVAQATVSLFTVLLGAATYGLVRADFPRWTALGASLLVIGAPETAFWGRQVMLDIPAYAALVAGVYFYARYQRSEQTGSLYFALIAILAAIYIKLTAVFLVPVLAVHLVATKGWRALRDRHIVTVGILGILGLMPAMFLTLKFGAVNVQSVAGRSTDLPRSSVAAWVFYAKLLPDYLGYIAFLLGLGGVVLVLRRRTAPLDASFAWLLLGWLVFGYLFFSAIDVREPRHGIMMAFPLVIFAVLAVHRALPARTAPAAIAGLGVATLLYSAIFDPPPRIEGYAQAADYVARHAPKNGVVLFSGYRDGNFVFNLRTHEERRDLWTIRADKLLLRIAIERIRGVQQSNLDEKQIAAALRQYGVSLVVSQPGFWTDLREMARLSTVLHTADFEKTATFDITGTVPHADTSIEIYKPTYPVEPPQRRLRIDMPIIGQSFGGAVGSQ